MEVIDLECYQKAQMDIAGLVECGWVKPGAEGFEHYYSWLLWVKQNNDGVLPKEPKRRKKKDVQHLRSCR